MRLILASASPRRRDLLTAAGLVFDVEPSLYDETLHTRPSSPQAAAVDLAVGKALAVARQHAGEHAVVLAADTIVAVGPDDSFELLGKPVDAEDERRMLRLLSNSRHQVVTGVCVVDCRGVPVGVGPGLRTGVETTYVTMRTLSSADIEAYVATDEWRDKAGGYAIQDGADRFVTCLEGGGRDNVVGLPVALALRLIAEGLAPTRSAP